MKKMTKLTAVILCLVMLFTLIACGSNTQPPAPPQDSGSPAEQPTPEERADAGSVGGYEGDTIATKADPTTITVAAFGDPAHMDPQNDGFMVQSFLVKNIFDTLLEVDPVTGQIVPGLATHWEWIDDTHLKMTLRQGVRFHNGDPFTSEDVLFTIRRFADSANTATLYASFDGENSTANGDYEVTIAFKQPFPPAIAFLTRQIAAMLPSGVLSEDNDALRMNPVGTGAFSFVSWTQGSEMILKRNDDWWGEPPFFENVRILFNTDATARSIATESGDADIGVALDSSVWRRIYDGLVPNMIAASVPCPQTGTFVFNYVNNEALNDIRVRRAMAHAIDWPAAIEASAGELAFLGDSIFAPTIFSYEMQGYYEYDPELSRQLLAEAGFEDGLALSAQTNMFHVAMSLMEIIQSYFSDVGITLSIANTDTPTWFEQRRAGGVDVSLTADAAQSYDPAEIMNQTTINGGFIVGAIQDPHYNELVNAALMETNPERRAELYAELQRYVFENVLSIPMYVVLTSYVYWDYLEGFVPDPVQGIDLRIISLKT